MKSIFLRLLPILVVAGSIFGANIFEFNYLAETRATLASFGNQPSRGVEPIPEFIPAPKISFGEIRDPFARTFDTSDDTGAGYQDPDTLPNTNRVKLKPEDISLVGLEAGHALIKLPDQAVYLVKENDELWNGEIIIISISNTGVIMRLTSSGVASTLEKLDIK